jgi:hypothetical protein
VLGFLVSVSCLLSFGKKIFGFYTSEVFCLGNVLRVLERGTAFPHYFPRWASISCSNTVVDSDFSSCMQ